MENKRKQWNELQREHQRNKTKKSREKKPQTVMVNQWKALCNDINLECHRKLNGPTAGLCDSFELSVN